MPRTLERVATAANAARKAYHAEHDAAPRGADRPRRSTRVAAAPTANAEGFALELCSLTVDMAKATTAKDLARIAKVLDLHPCLTSVDLSCSWNVPAAAFSALLQAVASAAPGVLRTVHLGRRTVAEAPTEARQVHAALCALLGSPAASELRDLSLRQWVVPCSQEDTVQMLDLLGESLEALKLAFVEKDDADDVAEAMVRFFRRARSLRVLELSETGLKDDRLARVHIEALAGPALVDFRSYNYEKGMAAALGRQADALQRVLATTTTLTTLALLSNGLDDASGVAIAEALVSNRSITTLSVEENALGEATAHSLGRALAVNSTLTSINLYENGNMGNALGHALASAFSAKTTALRTVWVGQCGMQPDGAQAMGAALEGNCSLREIDLCGNNLGVEGGRALGAAFAAGSRLRSLVANECELGSEGVAAILDGLAVGNRLMFDIDLGHNGATDAIGPSLVNFVGATLNTRRLSVNEATGMTGTFMPDLLRALDKNASLESISLPSHRNIKTDDVFAIMTSNYEAVNAVISAPYQPTVADIERALDAAPTTQPRVAAVAAIIVIEALAVGHCVDTSAPVPGIDEATRLVNRVAQMLTDDDEGDAADVLRNALRKTQ